MSLEDRPQRQDGPPTRDEWEMSFVGNLTGAVDTLFTHKPIVETLQGLEGDEQVQAFVRRWKQAVNLHLEETAWQAVESFLTDFERFQTGENLSEATASGPNLPEAMALARQRRPFTVASICREDLQGILTEAEIGSLSDADMATIADRMSDSYRDSGGYWQSLEIMAKFVLSRQEPDKSAASPNQGRDAQAKTA